MVYPEIPAIDPPPLIDVWDDPGAQWTVACNWLGPLVDGRATLIRRGFPTDGASIPRFTWRLIGHPFQLPLLAYALPHDADYGAELFPKTECDWRFLTNQQTDGHICWAKRNAIWSAVHTCGGSVWNKHTDESIADARTYCRVVGEEEWIHLNAIRRIDPSDVVQTLQPLLN
ncbi:MAG: DUF1353 domain-containing protein [Kiritimatiellae bacterium]|nr:DUF1353 domain-containing protein [Kiritimatiellia bacterium]